MYKIVQLLTMMMVIAACATTGAGPAVDTNAVQMADRMMQDGRFDTAAALYSQTPLLSEGQRRLKLAAVAMGKGHFDLANRQIRLAEQAGMEEIRMLEARAWLYLYQRDLDRAVAQFADLSAKDVASGHDRALLHAVSLDLSGASDRADAVWAQVPASTNRDVNFGIHIALAQNPEQAVQWFRQKLADDAVADKDRPVFRQNLAMMMVWQGDVASARLVLADNADKDNLIKEYGRLRQSDIQARLLLWQWLVQSTTWIPIF